MTRDRAHEAILSHLRTYEKATDLDLIGQIGGDEQRFRRLRSELIMDGLAKDIRGEGLAYTGPEETGRYDLFISYAHADNTDGTITALVEEIKAHQRRIDGLPMRIFFDTDRIKDMDDWEMRILSALRESRVMIAMLSPAYFKSPYCEKEWRWFVDHETERAMSMEAIAPVYTITVSDFEPGPEDIPGDWPRNLKRRQYLDARPWWNEGTEAFARAEIRERLEELDRRCYEKVQAARHLESSRSTIPTHNPYFVGRSEQIRTIREAFAKPGPSLVALCGLGGMGKSVLAHEYAHVYARRYPVGRFLLPAEDKEDLKAFLVTLAPDLGMELTDEERADTDLAHRRVCATLSSAAKERGGPALVLLDNVDDPGLLTRAAVSGALPPTDDLHVIATTRLEEDSLQAGTRLEVGPLPEGDAEALFAKHRPFMDEYDPTAARTAAQGIARRLGCYPLAVEVAAVYLRETPEVSYSGFLGRLEREGIGAVEGAGADARIQLSNHPETLVSALIEPTLDGLSEAEALAIEYAAVLPPDAVPVPWLRALVSMERPGIIPEAKPGYPDPWRTLVTRRLRGLRLLTGGDHPKVMRMHRVVQEIVRARMSVTRVRVARERCVDHAIARAEEMKEAWTDRAARWEITPLLRAAEAALEKGHGDAPRLTSFVQIPLSKLGQYGEARQLLESAVKQDEQSGRNPRRLAVNYNNLAASQIDLGRLEPARELMQKAIAIQEAALGTGHLTLATSYSNLGLTEHGLGRLGPAQELMLEAIAILEVASDADHPTLATSYSNLAGIEQDLGRFEPARKFMLKAIQINEATYDADHPTLATSYSNLAMIEQDLGRLESARKLMRKAIRIGEAVYDAGHPALATRYLHLASIERDLGRLEPARELMQKAIAIYEAAYDASHPTLASSYSNLARIEKALGRLEPARELMQKAIAIYEAAFDTGHPALAISYSSLATIEKALGHPEPARELMQKAIRIQEAAYDAGHPALATSYSNLAGIEQALGRLEPARELMLKAIEIEEVTLGAEHPTLATGYNNLGRIEHGLGRLEPARMLMLKAIQIKETAFDASHPTLATSYSNLALIEQDLGRLRPARELMLKAIRIGEAAFDADPPTLATSYSNLALIEQELGRLGPAREQMRKALAIREHTFGPTHEHTLRTVRDLATLSRLYGDFGGAEHLWDRYVTTREADGGSSYDGWDSDQFERAKLDLSLEAFEEALERIQPVLKAWTTAHGADHGWTAVARSVRARALRGLGQHDESLRIFRESLPIVTAEYGAEHESVGFLRREIGRAHLAHGNASDAEEHAEAARRIQEATLPPEHYELVDTYYLLGQIADARSAPDATAWMQKAYDIRSAHTPAHPDTVALRDWLDENDVSPGSGST